MKTPSKSNQLQSRPSKSSTKKIHRRAASCALDPTASSPAADQPSERELDTRLLEPARIILPLIAAAGRSTLLVARANVGKINLLAYAVGRMTRGQPLFGEEVVRGRVLWVALEEDTLDTVNCFVEMGADPELVTIVTRLPCDGALGQLRAEIDATEPDLVVIDSLDAFCGGLEDENNATAVTAVLKPLVDFVHESGIALVLLRDANESGSASGSCRGSVMIGAAMDMILEMAEMDPMSNVRRVSVRGRFKIPSYELEFDPRTLGRRSASCARKQRRTTCRTKIIAWLRANPSAGRSALAQRWPEPNTGQPGDRHTHRP